MPDGPTSGADITRWRCPLCKTILIGRAVSPYRIPIHFCNDGHEAECEECTDLPMTDSEIARLACRKALAVCRAKLSAGHALSPDALLCAMSAVTLYRAWRGSDLSAAIGRIVDNAVSAIAGTVAERWSAKWAQARESARAELFNA